MIEYFIKNGDTILEYTIQHFALSFSAVILSLIVWIPVGVLMSRNELVAKSILGISNVLYCIPSIAMFAIFITIPQLGLGRKSSLLALVIYAMMPMTRSVYTGIKNIDKKLLEAVKGIGMDKKSIFWEVEMPMATPSVFSGIRVMTVMIISASTVATYIGEKNLGRLITQGISRNNMEMITIGAVMVSVVAVLTDFILSRLEKRVSWKQ